MFNLLKKITLLIVGVILIHGVSNAETYEFKNPDMLKTLFDKHQYNMAGWAKGNRAVPRLYLQQVPSRWSKKYAPKASVDNKKQFFFFVYAPLVLKVNNEIKVEREKLNNIIKQLPGNLPTERQRKWLNDLASRYRLKPVKDFSNTTSYQELLSRVDEVPPSLALAQAAIESGWGTSRFSYMGNALFGQWTWGGGGIKPKEQRKEKGNYGIKSFPKPGDSVKGYIHNLNTNRAYAEFRNARKSLRNKGNLLTGKALVPSLISYSERGQAYVNDVLGMMRYNKLDATDHTFLMDMKPILLVPVGEGVN